VARSELGPGERCTRRLRPEAPQSDPRDDQLVGGPRSGGKEVGSSSASVRSASSRRPIRRRRRTSRYRACAAFTPVAVLFKRRPRCAERFHRPAQVARDEGDLGLGDDAPRASHRLFWTEGARRTSHQSPRSNEIAALRHRDASKRKRSRVVAQGNPLQCPEGITRCKGTCRGRDQWVHRNPATLVTPTLLRPALNISHENERTAKDTRRRKER